MKISSFGAFDRLPAELIRMILETTDLQSITNFRSVNALFRIEIDNLLLYKRIFTSAPDVIRALIGSGMARNTRLSQLHAVIQADQCAFCTNKGKWINLLLCERVCHDCTSHDVRLKPLTVAQAQEQYALNAAARDTMSRFYPVHGELIEKKNILRPWFQTSTPEFLDKQIVNTLRCARVDTRLIDRLEQALKQGTFFSTLRELENHQGSLKRWEAVQNYAGMLQQLKYASNACALVDISEAEKAAIALYGTLDRVKQLVDARRAKVAATFKAAKSQNRKKNSTNKPLPKPPPFPPFTVTFDAEELDPRRLAVVLRLEP